METFTYDNYKYQFGLTDEQFKIIITEDVSHKEFSLIIENQSVLFENHSIIKNTETLQKVLHDAFEKAFDITMGLVANEDQYHIHLMINTTYIKDEITLDIPMTNEGVKLQPEQMIDKKFSVLTEYLNTHIMDMITVQEHQENAHKNLSHVVKTHEPLLIKFNEQLIALKKEHDQLKYLFMEYIDKHPIIIAEKSSKGIFGKQHKRLHYLMSDARSIKITYDNKAYYLNNKYKIVNFSYKDFQYLRHLEKVTLENCKVHNLDFLNCARTLTQIELISMPEITTINWLTTCVKLAQVFITDERNITDINKLSVLIVKPSHHNSNAIFT